MKTEKKSTREKPIPKSKITAVKDLKDRINNNRTFLLVSSKGLPSKQFHEIKKKLRGVAEIKVAKKSIINRAIDGIEKGYLKNLKKEIDADIALLFSDLDPFELASMLVDSQSNRKAKQGEIAPMDIEIEAGPTELLPGPAISELSGVGLKVAVKEGKLDIIKGAVIVKKRDEIKPNVASVLGKLNILPMKAGFRPLAAYDSKDDKFYTDIVIDKEGTLQALKEFFGKALDFALKIQYVSEDTIPYLIRRAGAEEKALSKFSQEKPAEERKEEPEKQVNDGRTESKESENG